jgi:hypothetical protein
MLHRSEGVGMQAIKKKGRERCVEWIEKRKK